MCPSPASRPEVGSRPIQPAPGTYDLRPRVQVGEVAFRCRRVRPGASRRRRAGSDSRRRNAPRARDGAGSARAATPNRGTSRDAVSSVSSQRLDAGLHADRCSGCRAAARWFNADQQVDRDHRRCAQPLPRNRRNPVGQPGPERFGLEEGREFAARRPRSTRTDSARRYFSTKKSNGLMTVMSATRSTVDLQARASAPGKTSARDPVAVRILLPVEEMALAGSTLSE